MAEIDSDHDDEDEEASQVKGKGKGKQESKKKNTWIKEDSVSTGLSCTLDKTCLKLSSKYGAESSHEIISKCGAESSPEMYILLQLFSVEMCIETTGIFSLDHDGKSNH